MPWEEATRFFNKKLVLNTETFDPKSSQFIMALPSWSNGLKI
jgi:hypothetical protein